jgi:hypothetical protein
MTYECSWCTRTERFDGDEAEAEAREAGWFYLVTPDNELCFCGTECLLSFL